MNWARVLIITGLAVPAVACAIAAVAAQGGRVSARLDVLTHFAPIYLGLGLITAVLGLGLGRAGFAWIVTPGLISALAAAALMAPEYLAAERRPSVAPGPRLTVVQFNTWGGNPTPDRALAWILAQQPDIVVLEEGGRVGPGLARAGFHVSCPLGYATIYSKLPVVSDNTPTGPDAGRVLVSRVAVGGRLGAFTVFGIHRPWPIRLTRDRGQTARLHEMVREVPADRTLLIGDFNSTPWSFARRREDVDLGLIRRTRALFTWPADRLSHNHLPAPFPTFPIDHVYAGPAWRTVEVRRGPRLGSDHYPVVVVLAPQAVAATETPANSTRN